MTFHLIPRFPLQTGVDNREHAPTPATDFDQNFMKERPKEQEGKTELDEEKLGTVKSWCVIAEARCFF